MTDCHLRCRGWESYRPVLEGPQRRCSPATMTIQRPPILVEPCFDGFVLNYAWLVASSPPSPLRQMLDRWAAFQSDSRHLCTRVITSLRSHSFKLPVTISQVRLTALK